MPNKLSQFWRELKRRNVTRVLAVYIAVAFMLLELLDMISDPFGLPEWSMKVGFLILLGGLVITLIYSWIYDIHPDGGIVKTEPADMKYELKERDYLELWKYFDQKATSVKGAMFKTLTWIIGYA